MLRAGPLSKINAKTLGLVGDVQRRTRTTSPTAKTPAKCVNCWKYYKVGPPTKRGKLPWDHEAWSYDCTFPGTVKMRRGLKMAVSWADDLPVPKSAQAPIPFRAGTSGKASCTRTDKQYTNRSRIVRKPSNKSTVPQPPKATQCQSTSTKTKKRQSLFNLSTSGTRPVETTTGAAASDRPMKGNRNAGGEKDVPSKRSGVAGPMSSDARQSPVANAEPSASSQPTSASKVPTLPLFSFSAPGVKPMPLGPRGTGPRETGPRETDNDGWISCSDNDTDSETPSILDMPAGFETPVSDSRSRAVSVSSRTNPRKRSRSSDSDSLPSPREPNLEALSYLVISSKSQNKEPAKRGRGRPRTAIRSFRA
ncbi:hypothetical protein QBC33DRAFT_553492 [Phialemonium atrogriseum]|uniref:Uncharacterized protein n=1 Tax=Phialemonium atrogriseum TaxID=1093897 RepID=A0AAJ0BRF6_9PEZI|nr:uncharacterized protein QBC33DRAFT_553492 [Phialemonium atrogriseum]KAK1761647.1 hypothetical protein QBC33DRAFT_553492 [Phialemonium atrogriseum]